MTSPLSTPPTAVLDTNVWLDLLWFRDARAQPLAQSLNQGTLVAMSCPALRRELAHQLGSARLAAWAGAADLAGAARTALAHHDGWVRTTPDPGPTPPAARLRCSDVDDQVFIDLAMACGACWLLSHDRALLKLARRARSLGLRIATPAQWQAALATKTPCAHEKGRPEPPP